MFKPCAKCQENQSAPLCDQCHTALVQTVCAHGMPSAPPTPPDLVQRAHAIGWELADHIGQQLNRGVSPETASVGLELFLCTVQIVNLHGAETLSRTPLGALALGVAEWFKKYAPLYKLDERVF